jgi:hypothetical protein
MGRHSLTDFTMYYNFWSRSAECYWDATLLHSRDFSLLEGFEGMVLICNPCGFNMWIYLNGSNSFCLVYCSYVWLAALMRCQIRSILRTIGLFVFSEDDYHHQKDWFQKTIIRKIGFRRRLSSSERLCLSLNGGEYLRDCYVPEDGLIIWIADLWFPYGEYIWLDQHGANESFPVNLEIFMKSFQSECLDQRMSLT